jgi:hypothetical protein
MTSTTRERVLAELEEGEVDLPEDGLTVEKIRERAYRFQFESGERLSFRIERHPTMYLSAMGVSGLDSPPARFHVVTEYQLALPDETWHIEELASTFKYEPWMVIEAELGGRDVVTGPVGEAAQTGIEEVTAAEDPEVAFEDVFGSWIGRWEEKFDEFDGRKVPEEDKAAIIELLVGELRDRAELD